jgi:hypothetical protein
MFCNLFWNPDCPLYSLLNGQPLRLYDLLLYSTLPRGRANRRSAEKSYSP